MQSFSIGLGVEREREEKKEAVAREWIGSLVGFCASGLFLFSKVGRKRDQHKIASSRGVETGRECAFSARRSGAWPQHWIHSRRDPWEVAHCLCVLEHPRTCCAHGSSTRPLLRPRWTVWAEGPGSPVAALLICLHWPVRVCLHPKTGIAPESIGGKGRPRAPPIIDPQPLIAPSLWTNLARCAARPRR